MTVLEARHVYKVFGDRARDAVAALKSGDEAADVGRRFDVVPAVVDADLAVQAGEIFVVMGLSGSGKSTLIRTLNGLYPTTAGEVSIHGRTLEGIAPARLRQVRREHISMVFQHFALFPHRTVLENAAYGLEIKDVSVKERRERADRALDLVGLNGWGHRRPGELSGGMRQRVGLARALAADTDIILMDEAFSALDPLIRREMQDQLIDLQQRLKKTIVFITHDLNEAMRIGDRIAMMHSGRIVQIGSAAEILSHPATDYVASFISDVDRSRVLTARSIMDPVSAGAERGGGAVGGGGVAPDTVLADLFGHAARSAEPLPVRDAGGALLGTIPRERLLQAMDSRPAAPPGRDAAAPGSSGPGNGSGATAAPRPGARGGTATTTTQEDHNV